MMKEKKSLSFLSGKTIMIYLINQPWLAIFMPWQRLILKDNFFYSINDAHDPAMNNSAWAMNHANKIHSHGI